VRALGALRGIGAETGATRFQRGKKTPAVPANVPRTMLEMLSTHSLQRSLHMFTADSQEKL